MQGLEDQLLGEVVRQERPELEEGRDRLVVSIAADKRQLQVGDFSSSIVIMVCSHMLLFYILCLCVRLS